MATYIAMLRKDRRSDYSVDFPDLPGCVTAGRTLEEARRNAAEALAFHLDGMARDGEKIPEPQALDEILADPDHRDGVPFLVDAATPETRVVRVNITLPANVLEAVDDFARHRRTSRSALLAHAAMTMIRRGRGKAV
jgi:predicted RNase H-like HicB family nuclease